MISSRSEQLQTNSSFLSPVPTNPSWRLIYNFWLASTTLVTSIFSKFRISVRRSWPSPYLFLRYSNQLIVTPTILARSFSISAISALILAISSSALSLLYFRIRCILISRRRTISSRVTSRMKEGLKGSNLLSMKATTSS